MPNRQKKYYVGDDVTFRGTFKIDGVEQTPDAGSAKVLIMQVNKTTPVVVETAAVIATNQIRYKYTPLVVGRFTCFLTAAYDTAADKRTGVIEFVVKKKECH